MMQQERRETPAFTPIPEVVDRIDIRDLRKTRLKAWIITCVLLVIAVGGGFAATIMLGGAELTVYPKQREISVGATFTGSLNPKGDQLGYELLSLAEEGEKRIAAKGQEKVSTKASGKITIYNNFSTTPQRLVKNTRFESTEGLIFRISESVNVPGYTKKADGTIEPGSAVAIVTADGTGEAYNVIPSMFTVPGLKGSPQFDKIFAESKEPFVGGFDGMKYMIDEAELATARQELHMELRDKLLKELKNKKPNGYVFYEPSITFAYNSLPSTDAGPQTAVIKEQARLLAPLFKEDVFASRIAKEGIPGYEDEAVRIEDPSTLTFSYPSTTTEDISATGSVKFNLRGKAMVVWVYDAEKLRKDVLGLSKTALPSVLSGYPSIATAEVKIRPFWKTSFPKDLSHIRIIEMKGTPQKAGN